MFVLIGELEGDYKDQYERRRDVLRVSEDEDLLKAFASNAPAMVRKSDSTEFFYIDGEAYIALDIEEVDEMTTLESNAYDIGYVAFLSQKKNGLHKAPTHTAGSSWRVLWERGWKDAEKEANS